MGSVAGGASPGGYRLGKQEEPRRLNTTQPPGETDSSRRPCGMPCPILPSILSPKEDRLQLVEEALVGKSYSGGDKC